MSLVSTLFIVLSTIVLCLNTLPSLQEKGHVHRGHSALEVIETVCVAWFTIEYLIRMVSCPNKKEFFKGILNGIDVLAILPFYVGVIFEAVSGTVSTQLNDARRIMQILRVFRTIRIFKIARHSAGLQVLGYTVKESTAELSLLFLLLLMGMILFSSLMYYAEEEVEGTKFTSIIQAFWWAIISMTTVGYGDMYPHTFFGKIVGSFCCISGILFIALPIPTIVGNFSKFYKEHVNKQKLQSSKLLFEAESPLQLDEEEIDELLTVEDESSIVRLRKLSNHVLQRSYRVAPAEKETDGVDSGGLLRA